MHQNNNDRHSRGDGQCLTDPATGASLLETEVQRLLACQILGKLKFGQGIHVLRLSLGCESLVDRRESFLCAIKPYSHSFSSTAHPSEIAVHS